MSTAPDDRPSTIEHELRDVQSELVHVRDLYRRLLAEQVRHDRDVYTAARRAAQDDRRAWSDHHFQHIIERSLIPVSGLIYRVQQLPERPGKAQVAELKAAAVDADWTLRSFRKATEAAPDFGARVRAEVTRLRGYIRRAGGELHRAAGDRERDGDRCCCAGCELVRGMDDTREEDTA